MLIQKIGARSGTTADKYDCVGSKNSKLVCKHDVPEFRAMGYRSQRQPWSKV